MTIPWIPVTFMERAMTDGTFDPRELYNSSMNPGIEIKDARVDGELVRRFLWNMIQGMGTTMDWIYIGWSNGGVSAYAQDGDDQTWIASYGANRTCPEPFENANLTAFAPDQLCRFSYSGSTDQDTGTLTGDPTAYVEWDARIRPWYTKPKEQDEAVWSDIYMWVWCARLL